MYNIRKVKFDYVVGIDPDIEKNGVSLLEVETKKVNLYEFSFSDTLDYLLSLKRQMEIKGKRFIVVIEAGWLNKGNWHLRPSDSKAVAAAKGRNTGMNHQTGILLCELCEHYQIPHDAIKPLVKCWRGKDRKITHEEISKFMNVKGRENQEARDAALIAWVYAGLPIKMI